MISRRRFVAAMSALPLVRLLGIKRSAERPYSSTSDKATGAEDYTPFVKIAIGNDCRRLWFRHSDIANGGVIEFTIGPQPNFTFGQGEDALPPSMYESEA